MSETSKRKQNGGGRGTKSAGTASTTPNVLKPAALTPETIATPPAESVLTPLEPLPTLSPELSKLTASALKLLVKTFPIPPFLLPIYQAASIQYGVPWEVLAAINEIETNFGRDLAVSSAGAEGWMQFLPSTWANFGVDADGRGKANPYDPVDAIFAAARYLRAAGASTSLPNAVFAYNHASWYVNSVELRARLLQALPQGLVDGLMGLMQASYPVAGHLGRDATVAPKLVELGGHLAATVAAPGNAAVIAGADSKVVALGDSSTLGRYITLKDSYGDLITYGGLGELATVYPQVTPEVESIRQLTAGLGLRVGSTVKRAKKLPPATRLSAASFSGLPTATASDRKAIAAERSAKGSATVAGAAGSGAGVPLVKERLFADPDRPASYAAGGSLQLQSSVRSYLLGSNGKLGRASDVLAHQVRLTEGKFTLAPLTAGADVVAGTVLGRTSGRRASNAKLIVEVKPAGAGAPIDPRAVIASWRLLGQLTGGTRLLSSTRQGSAYDNRNGSLGQLLMSDRATLEDAVLNDPRLNIDTCDREAIAAGEVDTRILSVLEYLSYSDLAPTVTGLAPNDSGLSCAAPAGSGPRFEITAINGVSVLGHQRAGGLADLTDRQLLALQGRLAPSRVISLRRYPWDSEALSLPDHAADIEVDFGSTSSFSKRSLRAAWSRLTKRLNQLSGS